MHQQNNNNNDNNNKKEEKKRIKCIIDNLQISSDNSEEEQIEIKYTLQSF